MAETAFLQKIVIFVGHLINLTGEKTLMEEQKSAKKRKPIWRRMVKICLLSVVTFLLLLFAGAAILFTPKRLTPIAERLADALFLADFRFDTLKVSLFEDFPYVNLTVINGKVRSRAFDMLPPLLQGDLPPDCDSLLRFDELSVSLHLQKLFNAQVDIRRVRLRNAYINAYISPYGIANWEIWLPDTTVVDKKEVEAFHINLQRLIIRDGCRISYNSDPNDLSASLQLGRLFLRGDIGAQFQEIKLETLSAAEIRLSAQMESMNTSFTSSLDSLRLAAIDKEMYSIYLQSINTITMNSVLYAEKLPVVLNGALGFSLSRLDSLFLKDFTVSAAQIPMVLDGSVVMADPHPRLALACTIDTLPISQAIALLPPSLIPEVQSIETDLSAKIGARINYPAYTLDISTSGGYLHYPSQNAYIKTLALDATYAYRPNQPEQSGIDLRRCDLEASGISLHAKGSIQNLLGDPDIDLSLLGAIQLDTLYRILPLPDNVTARGALAVDASFKFLLSDLLHGNLDGSTLRGRVEAERLLLRLPQDSILMMARGANISFGANQNQRDSLIDMGRQILRLSFRADSANIRYKQQFHLAMGSTRLSARSAASALFGDSTQVHPFNGSLETNYLSFKTADSTHIMLSNGASSFSLLPAPHNHSLPVIATQLKANYFEMSDAENRYELLSPQIALQATRLQSSRPAYRADRSVQPEDQPYDPEQADDQTNESIAANDSIPPPMPTPPRRGREESQRPVDELSSGDLDLELDTETKRLIRQWQLDGAVQAIGGSLSTPYFPLPVTLGETDIEFTTDEVQLMQTEITAGRSKIECTGKISNLRQVLLGRGNLSVYGFVRSDTLDINELMQAANAGSQFAASGIVVQPSEEVSSLIIIPANLNLNLKLFSGYTRYSHEYLTDLSGSLSSQNRTLQINDLEASSSAGSFKLSALYATRSRNNITAGFDLEMNEVRVDRLIALIPSIDTLAPMLRSFEGVVNCQISATTSMDSEMNLLLPTLKAACRIQGQNMVLLDGETFTEISKMLHFKNKNRNLIDQIAVDFIIHDNQIDVFPFIMEMDRYRAAVSGVHNFDMSFGYHISVLRSPIPFKLGVDVTGTLDDLHYRLVRCRYRDTNIPSYVELIDATRISLLQAIKAFDPAAAFQTVTRTVTEAAAIEEVEVEEEEIIT